jgi:alkylation response protein AidB-like acyl-CoA dehydrogenase
MDYQLTELHQEIRDIARRIADEKIKPVRAQYDQDGTFPWDIVKVCADADLFAVFLPEQYGGLDGGIMALVIATEELSRACGGIALCLAASALGTIPIELFGTDEQKDKYLPDLAAGKTVAAFALTEPAAGSDASAIQTTAVKDGDYYVINGLKQWITNGGEAGIYVVVTMTDRSKGARGASTFILEKGMEGFEFGKKEDKMGIRASATRELIFNDCRVHKSQLLGRQGMGFLVAMKTFDRSRPGVAAQALGIAQGALDEAINYARQREQFGHPIISFQGMQFKIAEMAMRIEAARALIYAVARSIDAGDTKCAKESAMCKTFASDVAMYVTTEAVQVLGGYGYMKDYPVEKMMRDAKITQIYEGTNEIQRSVIATNLIKEYASKK